MNRPAFEICLFVAKSLCRAYMTQFTDLDCEDCKRAMNCPHLNDAAELSKRIPSLRAARGLPAC